VPRWVTVTGAAERLVPREIERVLTAGELR
jgi:hypothetical protein